MIGLHSNMLLAFPQDASGIELNDQENADLAEVATFMTTGAAYQEIQGKNPQTLGYGLVDSPAAQCAWVVEKFWDWTDCDGHPEKIVSRDDLLDNVMLYWLPATGASSASLWPTALGWRPSW